MGNAVRVRLVERIGDLDGAIERLLERHRPAREPLRQRFALEELHDEKIELVLPPTSNSAQMFGCCSAAIERASSWNRESPSGLVAAMTLMATTRSSLVSRAL